MTYQLWAIVIIVVSYLFLLPIHDYNRHRGKQASLIVFNDYQSPSCRDASLWIRRLRGQHPNELRVVIKHFPQLDHPQAFLAARAAFCAACHGRFWDYHDRLLMVSDLTEPMLLKYAVEIDLDEYDFEQCLESDASRDAVTEDREEALTLKLSSPPTFILNGRILIGVRSFDDLLKEVRAALRQTSVNRPNVSESP